MKNSEQISDIKEVKRKNYVKKEYISVQNNYFLERVTIYQKEKTL